MTTPEHATAGKLTEHPLRYKLNNELHARPPVPVAHPQLVSYVALMHDGVREDDELRHLQLLADAYACRWPRAVICSSTSATSS
jgi:hypothetical protein